VKIRERLTLQFMLLTTGLLLVASIALYFFFKQSIESQFENKVMVRSRNLASLWVEMFPQDSLRFRKIDGSRKYQLPEEQTAIFDFKGKLIFVSDEYTGLPEAEMILAELYREKKWSGWIGDYFIFAVTVSIANEGYYVMTGARDTEGDAELSQLRLIMVGLYALMLAMVAITGWIFSGRALRPIHKVIADINRFSAESLDQRLQGGDKPDEVGTLVRIFNDLLGRIQAAVFMQKSFIANVSHELKNPITKVVSQVEVTLLSERESETYREVLQSVLEDVKEMNLLTQSLLDLSTLSHDPKSFSFLPVRMDEVIWEVREKIQALPQQYRVDFGILRIPENESEMTISGNYALLRTAMNNIIENAAKYSVDRVVDVVMQCSAEMVEVSIINKGPGIPPEKLPYIFEFGVRGGNTPGISGYGLGLPLAKRIINLHKGELKVETVPGLTTVTAVFPH